MRAFIVDFCHCMDHVQHAKMLVAGCAPSPPPRVRVRVGGIWGPEGACCNHFSDGVISLMASLFTSCCGICCREVRSLLRYRLASQDQMLFGCRLHSHRAVL